MYLLVRAKKTLTAAQRVQKLLCGPLFHKLHAEAAGGGRNPFSRVHAVEGDMELPGLGLSAADKQQLLCEVDVVVHSAASLTLDAHIQDALRLATQGPGVELPAAIMHQHQQQCMCLAGNTLHMCVLSPTEHQLSPFGLCRSNFLGTKALLQLCAEMSHLRSFVYISTFFVNNYLAYNTPVKERVHYPTLQLAGECEP